MTSKQLFDECSDVVNGHYSEAMAALDQQVHGPGFFPGASGFFHTQDLNASVRRKYLVVGQDFGTESYMVELRTDPGADLKVGTGKIVRAVLEEASIREEDCFFTNALFGVRKSDEISGVCQGWTAKTYVKKCQTAFEIQLRAVQPQAIICLGGDAPRLLKSIFKGMAIWRRHTFKNIDHLNKAVLDIDMAEHPSVVMAAILLHPSFRKSNLRHRQTEAQSGHEIEIAILKTIVGKVNGV